LCIELLHIPHATSKRILLLWVSVQSNFAFILPELFLIARTSIKVVLPFKREMASTGKVSIARW
jgi:hypothetical protein